MTSRANQIQSMIADIDKLLTHKGKRLWGVISSQEEPRQVLERIRDFLANETLSETDNALQAQLPPLVAKFVQEGNQDSSVSSSKTESGDVRLSELIEPLKAELKTLLEERANLISEIRELEKKRLHDYSLAQQLETQEKIISEFMQVLKNRLSDDIDGDVSANITPQKALPPSGNRVDSVRVERLTQLTNDLDRRLVALDGTVNVVFEGLQRNIHAYHDSLSQALARMHHKGIQGEQLLEGLLQNFAKIPQQQEYPDLLEQTTDKIIVEDINAQSLESAGFYNRDVNDFENVDRNEEYEQDLKDFGSFDLDEEHERDINEKLEVTPDETIDNIEFSQPLEDDDDTLVPPDFSEIISQFQKESISEDLNEELARDNYSELEFIEEQEDIVKPQIFADSEAFDSPEKMQAVLSQLKKIAAETEQLPTDTLSESTNEDEVDELYASLFDSDNLTTSYSQTPEQQIRPPAIDVDILATSDFDAQVPEKQIEKEVVSQEVVFEVTPPSLTSETIDTSSDDEIPVTDPWFNDSNIDFANTSEFINKNTAKSSYRKIKATSEDTITSLTELIFEEEISPEIAAPPLGNSESQPEVVVENKEETVTPIEVYHEATSTKEKYSTTIIEASQEVPSTKEQETAAPIEASHEGTSIKEQETATPIEASQEVTPTFEEITTEDNKPVNYSESVIIPSKEISQLQQITLPVTPISQSNKNLDASTIETPFPQTEKTTVTSNEEKTLQENGASVNSTEIPPTNKGDTVWYLGLDLGTTGISAALLNRSTQVIHPIYWAQENQPQTASQTWNFRLPAEVYLPKTSPSQNTDENQAEQNIYSAYLKPYLQISLPYKNKGETASTETRQKWEPLLQLNEFSTVPLVWIVRSLSKLLLTLKSDSNSTTLGLTATAIGIEKEQFNSIINNIAGVICTCPSNWSEQYRFNLRESLLISKLVEHPQQVFFVEEAIASLLGGLEGANGEIVKLVENENSTPVVISDNNLIGNTLVINIGASATEMALVDLPENLQDLTHNEFLLHGFTCGGKAMEQDIITQLLLTPKWRKSRNTTKSSETANDNNPLHWQPNIPGLEQIRFSSLGLEQLELPRAGEPDISQRIRLQQRLESSPLGKALLDAAIALKLILQHQESFTIELANQRWELQRRDLESQVFVPFVRRINRELNKLLVTRGIPTEAINQIILSGGVSSITAISRWLRQKLPGAKIIQEKYLGENGTPASSRVATGLCLLPLHPLVLEIPRQQYTDYFLFTELLRLVPENALSFGEVIQLFEARGINTRTCQERLLAFLEGEIPPGLVPNNQDIQWLNQTSLENFNYKAMVASPLFDKQGSLSYRPNLQQLKYLRNYLDAIQASAHQSLEEPYIVNFAVGVSE
ncbi:MAG: hypothetical protein ACFB2X_07640 [Rivularia sp. (in: cyanobacteria)]